MRRQAPVGRRVARRRDRARRGAARRRRDAGPDRAGSPAAPRRAAPDSDETASNALTVAHYEHHEHDDDTLDDPTRRASASATSPPRPRSPSARPTPDCPSRLLLPAHPHARPPPACRRPASGPPAYCLGCPARFIWQVEEGGSSAKRWTPLPRKPRRGAGSRPEAGRRPVRLLRRTTRDEHLETNSKRRTPAGEVSASAGALRRRLALARTTSGQWLEAL